MNDEVKRKLLYLYFGFQSITGIANILMFFSLLGFILLVFALGWSSIDSFWKLLLALAIYSTIIGVYIFYLIITAKSVISTIKIVKKEPLTKFQKFCTYIFPIVTIPAYLMIIFISKIREVITFCFISFAKIIQALSGNL